jgi:hypothetical protein
VTNRYLCSTDEKYKTPKTRELTTKHIQTQVPKHPNCFSDKQKFYLIVHFTSRDLGSCSARPGSPLKVNPQHKIPQTGEQTTQQMQNIQIVS